MSDYPCTGCRSTTAGRLSYVYVQHFVDDELVRRRVRFCRDCLASYLPPLIEGADWSTPSRGWESHEEHIAWLATPVHSPIREPSARPAGPPSLPRPPTPTTSRPRSPRRTRSAPSATS